MGTVGPDGIIGPDGIMPIDMDIDNEIPKTDRSSMTSLKLQEKVVQQWFARSGLSNRLRSQ